MFKNRILTLTTLVLLTLTACSSDDKELSNKTDPNNQFNILIDKENYQIVYNTKYKGAVKVAYDLTRDKVNNGNIKARPNFYNEESLEKDNQTFHSDYTNTGYDRGHLANDASFDWSKESQLSTYSMANIVPMQPKVNRRSWLAIEDYERYLANQFNEIIVVNIVKYKEGTILRKTSLDELLEKRKFDTKAHKDRFIKKHNKADTYLLNKRIHVPVGFYKTLESKSEDFKECFYVENIESNSKTDHREYMVNCKDVPNIPNSTS